MDRRRERDQRRLAQPLREGFFRQRPSNAPIPVLERVDAHKIQMANPGAR